MRLRKASEKVTLEQRVGVSEWAVEILGKEHSDMGTARAKVMIKK